MEDNVRGLFDLPEDGLVSSLAMTPDGCYVFAAFGGGEVRLYAQALRTVGAASRSGTIVAQIKSKVRGGIESMLPGVRADRGSDKRRLPHGVGGERGGTSGETGEDAKAGLG